MATTQTYFGRTALLPLISAALLVTFAAPKAPASVPTSPPTFTTPTVFTNDYFPFEDNAVKTFHGKTDGNHVIVVDLYLDETRDFSWGGGTVTTRILQETEFEAGNIKEISRNHFAQADDGTIYYFGEIVDIYENGVVVAHDGSWLVGGGTLPSDPPSTANAPDPGLFMPANPEVGDAFKPEDLYPLVDETVTVLKVGKKVKVEAGKFDNVIKVLETTQLSSDTEKKWYAKDIGLVLVRAHGEWLELTATTFQVQ
ncbi:MAG: hypothetical protein V2A76_06955 [Planctomycetota bacterium]